ncbi:MAG: hypothetical protein PHG94_03315 [Syntrophomonas sp.]|nr:hypothetical protein [Syntrophomonas sp.]
MEKPILLGNFIFCSLQQVPLLGNDCQACDYLRSRENEHFCIYEAEVENGSADIYQVRAVIEVLLDLLAVGQKDLRLEELESLLLKRK